MRRILVPLSVALVALGLFWWTRDDGGPLHDVSDDVRACRENLHAIYDGIVEYHARFGHTPSTAGVGFFAELVASDVWEANGEHRKQLTCPGPGAAPVAEGTDLTALDSLDGAASAYAGRDTLNHPLEKFPAGGPGIQALVACDNAHGWNHEGVMNVLYSDRTVKALELAPLIERGLVPAGTTTLRVGPDSPLADLRALVAD